MSTVMGRLVFLSSTDEETWTPVRPEDVPEWVKHQDVLGNLANGDMARDEAQGPEWYRAERIGIETPVATPKPKTIEVAR